MDYEKQRVFLARQRWRLLPAAAARYVFLGVDQPSYRVHVFTGTLEYRF